MQQVYFKRMTKQDITKSVAICTDSVESFWDISKENALEYTPIKICHERNPDYFPGGITIHKGYQGEKDWRICGSEFKKLYSDDDPTVGDLMCIKKIGGDCYHLSIIKKDSSIYTFLETLFKDNDNYLIISKPEIDTISNNIKENTLIAKEALLRKFILSVIVYFREKDNLNALVPFSKFNSTSSRYKIEKDDEFNLTGMFIEASPKEIEEKNKDSERWFTEPFELNGKQVFLSTQWNANGNYQLTLDDFIKMIQCCYGKEYVYKLGDGNEHQLWLISKEELVSYAAESVGFDKNLLTAMRTKPFLLLAGISGTGKSRIVKQMAFESCPDVESLRSDKTSPGNYQLIEVKPNWHDSTEVLGYESEIGGKHYVATPFVKFLVKAMCYPDVPFFVCMDEMNLAPVEQYFAEFLSVLESRKLVDDKITSEPIIKSDIFKNHENQLRADLQKRADDEQTSYGDNATSDPIIEYGKFNEIYERLKVEGLRIPSNLIVVGTVNMDETTHQFSRKVIDRAMTIEMNIEDAETPFKNFFEDSKDLEYKAKEEKKELFLPTVVQAKEAMGKLSVDDVKCLRDEVPTRLYELNQALNGTPFKIAYRVQNELVLYFHELRKEHPEATAEELLSQAMDAILMLKVLPRIEGDEDLLEKPLKELLKYTESYEQAHAKVEEMQDRLNGGHFTSFWP